MQQLQLYERIFAEQRKQSLVHFTVDNPTKVVLTYSGSIASGKSTVTKYLVERYKPLVVNNDEVRTIIQDITKESTKDEVQALMFSYYKDFLRDKLYSSSNKIIILDSSIDRRYDIVNAEYTGNGYSIFIILFDHPRELIEKRIINRDGDLAEMHLKILDQAFIDNQSFLKQRKPDYVITEKNQNDIGALFKVIDLFITVKDHLENQH
jgi:predicted kinase